MKKNLSKAERTATFTGPLNDRLLPPVTPGAVLLFSVDLDPAAVLEGPRAARQLHLQGVPVQVLQIGETLRRAALCGPQLHQRVRVQRQAIPAGAEQHGRSAHRETRKSWRRFPGGDALEAPVDDDLRPAGPHHQVLPVVVDADAAAGGFLQEFHLCARTHRFEDCKGEKGAGSWTQSGSRSSAGTGGLQRGGFNP